MKKVFLLAVSALLFSSLAQAQDLKGRFGIGGRAYYLFKEIPGNISIIPYTGGEFNWVISQYLKYGGLTYYF